MPNLWKRPIKRIVDRHRSGVVCVVKMAPLPSRASCHEKQQQHGPKRRTKLTVISTSHKKPTSVNRWPGLQGPLYKDLGPTTQRIVTDFTGRHTGPLWRRLFRKSTLIWLAVSYQRHRRRFCDVPSDRPASFPIYGLNPTSQFQMASANVFLKN